MAFAIDSVVRGCHIHKNIWSAGINSKLTCSPKSAIVKTGMPFTHARSDTLKSSYDAANF